MADSFQWGFDGLGAWCALRDAETGRYAGHEDGTVSHTDDAFLMPGNIAHAAAAHWYNIYNKKYGVVSLREIQLLC